MADSFKFPHGYDVRVLRKEDVLNCIDDNIIDKDIALDIIKACEIDATNFIKEGRWAGIPFIGSIRIPKTVELLTSTESRELYKEAKDTLDTNKYVLFRHNYANYVGERVKTEKYYRYITSKFVGKNQKFFKRLSKKTNDVYARFYCYTLNELEIQGGAI